MINRYRCDSCVFETNNYKTLKRHIRTVHSNDFFRVKEDYIINPIKAQYSCTVCHFKGPTSESLNRHIKRNHEADLLKCNDCDYKTRRRSYMNSHIRSAHPGSTSSDYKTTETKTEIKIEETEEEDDSEVYFCKGCDFITEDKKVFEKHIISPYTCFRYKCRVCPFRTSYVKALQEHMSDSHEDIYRFNCDQCPKYYLYKFKLRRHIERAHGTQVYTCVYCKFKNSVKYELERHMVSKHGFPAKPERDTQEYPCYECSTKVTGKTSYKKHLLGHLVDYTGEEYYCLECDFTATTREEVMKHVELHRVLNYKCRDCDVSFGRLTSFRTHLRSKHEDSKDHLLRCEDCSYATSRNDAMKRHRNTMHLGLRLQCRTCSESFSERRGLVNHVMKKHPELLTEEDREIILACQHCSFKTTNKNWFNQHQRNKHSTQLVKIEVDPLETDIDPLAI